MFDTKLKLKFKRIEITAEHIKNMKNNEFLNLKYLGLEKMLMARKNKQQENIAVDKIGFPIMFSSGMISRIIA